MGRRRRLATGALAAAGLALHAGLGLQPVAAQTGLQSVEIIDPNGFARPMVAARIGIPQGWQSQGGVRWQPQAACQSDVTQFQFLAQDPTGRMAVELIPGTGWQANNLPQPGTPAAGCASVAIMSARQYLEALVSQVRPGARILDYRHRPDLIKVQRPPLSQVAGIEQRQISEGGEVLLAYEIGGQPMREVIQAVVDIYISRTAGPLPGTSYEFMHGGAGAAFAMRAPEGYLDFAAANAIQASFAPDPAWQAEMHRHHAANARIASRGSRPPTPVVDRTGEEIGDMMMKGWRNRGEIEDGGQDSTVRGIRETELYATPDGGTVELSDKPERVFQTDRGYYIGSDNALFDPYVDLGIGATELAPAE